MSDEKKLMGDQNSQPDFDIEDVEFDDSERMAEPNTKEVSLKRTSMENWPTMKTHKKANEGLGDKALDIPAFERHQRKAQPEKNLAPRRSSKGDSFLHEYGKYILCGLVAVVLVIILVVAGISLFKSDESKDQESSSSESSSAEESSSETQPDTSLQEEAVPALNTLMNTYYDGLIACDLATVHSIVEDDSPYTLEKLQKQREYIEDYLNIVCYTKPGLYEGEYVLYVYSEIKFANIATAAPQLNHYYVNQPVEGQYQLANGMLGNDKVEYMNRLDEEADVKALIDDVHAKLSAAMQSDENLNNLVQMLSNVPEETTEAPSEDVPTEQVPTEQAPAGEETFYVEGELFYRVNETVYPKEEVRVRAKNSLDSDVVGVLTVSDYVTRTGYSENWSQIIYNGYTAYVYKGFLTTQKPE